MQLAFFKLLAFLNSSASFLTNNCSLNMQVCTGVLLLPTGHHLIHY